MGATNLDALFFLVFALGVDIWPTVHAALFDVDGSDEFIGENGEYTREQLKRHKDNRRFWDVQSDDILLQGMHGGDLADDAKMVPVVQFLFEVDAATAQEIVDFAQSVIASESTLGFDYPLWTLNAFAFSAQGDVIPGVGTPPDTIVMGDGLLLALEEIGLAQNGPDFVHAHEFAHHVQFELGAFEPGEPTPEGTRRTELMADGFGAYFAAHPRGMSMQTKRIVDVVESAFTVGDCAFDSPGHHGTPNQRGAAAEWAADLANAGRGKGKIIGSAELLDRFDAHLPVLVAPDA